MLWRDAFFLYTVTLNRDRHGVSASGLIPCEPEITSPYKTGIAGITTSSSTQRRANIEVTVAGKTVATSVENTMSSIGLSKEDESSSTVTGTTESRSNTPTTIPRSTHNTTASFTNRYRANTDVTASGKTVFTLSENTRSSTETSNKGSSSTGVETTENRDNAFTTIPMSTHNTVTSYTNKYSCACSSSVYVNKTEEEIQEIIRLINKRLRLEKSLLTSYVIRKISAEDNRTSSKVMGTVGAIVLAVIFGSIMAIDLINIVTRRWKTMIILKLTVMANL